MSSLNLLDINCIPSGIEFSMPVAKDKPGNPKTGRPSWVNWALRTSSKSHS